MFVVKDAEFLFLPLGGVGEIGMNMAVYGYGSKDNHKWFIVDMGVSFAGGSNLPGVDLIFPDIDFLIKKRTNILGLFLTHAHEDHFGAVPDLWPLLKIPIYCTAFTARLLKTRKEHHFLIDKVPIYVFQPGEKIQIGPFEIEAVAVNHSIPDPVSLSIRTPLGIAIHTSDWKIDKTPIQGTLTDEKKFCEIGQKGVLALICDSTNALVEREDVSETQICKNLEEIITAAPGRVAVTTFSSNIGRLRSIALAAKKTDRRILLVGRSMRRCAAVGIELGYLNGIEPFLKTSEYTALPDKKTILVLTGSQGETRAALAQIASGERRDIQLKKGDIVIYSSRNIPGNEKAIFETQNLLVSQGIKIITNRDAPVHVSGHPYREQIRQMYEWVRPQILVPVHGEAIHLAEHAAFARKSGIKNVVEIRNGDILRLAPYGGEVIEKVSVGRLYKDGNLLGNEKTLGIAERRKLSYAGHIVLLILLDEDNKLVGEIVLDTLGIPKIDEHKIPIKNILQKRIRDTIKTMPRARFKDKKEAEEAFRKIVYSTIRKIWGKKTMVSVFLNYTKIFSE